MFSSFFNSRPTYRGRVLLSKGRYKKAVRGLLSLTYGFQKAVAPGDLNLLSEADKNLIPLLGPYFPPIASGSATNAVPRNLDMGNSGYLDSSTSASIFPPSAVNGFSQFVAPPLGFQIVPVPTANSNQIAPQPRRKCPPGADGTRRNASGPTTTTSPEMNVRELTRAARIHTSMAGERSLFPEGNNQISISVSQSRTWELARPLVLVLVAN